MLDGEQTPGSSFTVVSDRINSRNKQWTLYRFQSNLEYIMITFSCSFTIDNFFNFVLVSGDAEDPTILHYLVIYMFIGLPLNYMQVLLGQYSQLGVLFFKHLSPLGHGVGYVMVVNSFLYCSYHAVQAADCIMYFLACFEPMLYWLKCPEKFKDICWDRETNCHTDCVNSDVATSTFIYWKKIYMNDPDFNSVNLTFGHPILPRIIPLFVVWGLILLVVSMGINKYKKLIRVNLFLAFFCCLVLLLLALITKGSTTGIAAMFRLNVYSFVNSEAWCIAIFNMIHILALGRACHMLYGSYMAPSMSSDILSIAGIALNFFGTFVTSVISSAALGIIGTAAGVNDKGTKHIWRGGKYPALSVMPMAFGFVGVPQLWNMIYFLFCILMLLNSVITQTDGIVRSISDAHKRVRMYTTYMLAFLCASSAGLGLLLLSRDSFNVAEEFFRHAAVQSQTFDILVMSILTFWVYRVQRLSDDINFMQGAQPTKFWKICWYLIPAVLGYSFIMFVFFLSIHENDMQRILNAVEYMLLISAIPILIIKQVFTYLKLHNLIGLLQPEERWGPSDPQERHLRRLFNPRQEIKSRRRDDACHHRCLLGSKHLKIVEMQEQKLRNQVKYNVLSFVTDLDEAGPSNAD